MRTLQIFQPSSKKRKKSLTEALAGAAVAFSSVGSQKQEVYRGGHVESGPRKNSRAKNEKLLRVVQQLYDDGIINDKEFAEQKQNILTFLRKIN